MPADLLYLTFDPRSGSGAELIADLLARPEKDCALLEILFSLNFSVLGIDIHNNYTLVGRLVNRVAALQHTLTLHSRYVTANNVSLHHVLVSIGGHNG